MNKKADFGLEEIAKIILAVMVLIVLILFAFLYKDKSLEVIEKIKDFIRFGR